MAYQHTALALARWDGKCLLVKHQGEIIFPELSGKERGKIQPYTTSKNWQRARCGCFSFSLTFYGECV